MRVGKHFFTALWYALKSKQTEAVMALTRSFLRYVSSVAILCAVSACQSPDTYKYKMSPYSPATSSLWDAYTDPLPGWWSDTKALFKSGMSTSFTLQGPPATPKPRGGNEQVNFNRYSPVYLKVYKISVVDEYAQPKREPNVEHLLAVSPSEAVQSWSSRLRTSGGIYSMDIVIRDASVVSHRMPAQAEYDVENPKRRYDARLEVELRIYDRSGRLQSSVATVANRSAIMREHTTADVRRVIFQRLMVDLIEIANSGLEQKMFRHFSPFIDYTRKV